MRRARCAVLHRGHGALAETVEPKIEKRIWKCERCKGVGPLETIVVGESEIVPDCPDCEKSVHIRKQITVTFDTARIPPDVMAIMFGVDPVDIGIFKGTAY